MRGVRKPCIGEVDDGGHGASRIVVAKQEVEGVLDYVAAICAAGIPRGRQVHRVGPERCAVESYLQRFPERS